MKTYEAGYTAIKIVTLFGWIVIAVSFCSGIIVLADGPNEMGVFLMLSLVVVGAVQGTLLLGIGAIGLAILDGSTAQQESLMVLIEIKKSIAGEVVGADVLKDEKPTINNSANFEKSTDQIISNGIITGNTGIAHKLQVMANGKIRVESGVSFLEFENIEEARGFFSKNR